MNRSIALFVALVTLLAHILAIHNDGEGNFAFPYDQAYVAYRLAHNFVFEQQWAWNPGGPAFDSYASPLWVAVATVAERLSITVNLFCQTAGVLATLVTVIVMTLFRARRTANLIAPLLLVTSGCIAAAAANGTETAAFTMFAAASFLCVERGHATLSTLALALCVLTRPAGFLFAAGMLFLAIVERGRGVKRPLWPYLAPALVFALGLLIRAKATGEALPAPLLALLHPHVHQWSDGLDYLRDFVRVSVSPLLVAFPLAYLVRGKLSGTGARALFLALLWTAMVALQGRAPLPFAEAMVPALPFIFLAVQEGMIESLDGGSAIVRRLALFCLFAAMTGSALASKEPGDLGPIHAEQWHREWMRSSGSARYGYRQPLGRLGLEEEIRLTNRLRAVGLFLRDYLDPSTSVWTPWPGSMGYLSRLPVYDVLGRTNPVPGSVVPASWTRRERADILAVLSQDVDYVVPTIDTAQRTPTLSEIARAWCSELDDEPEDPHRLEAVENALAKYELITVPIRGYTRGAAPIHSEPFVLLRRRQLELQPNLEILLDAGGFRVIVRHHAHYQLVDLSLRIVDDRNRIWYVRPTGEPVRDTPVRARTGILLTAATRPIDLIHGSIPDDLDGARPVKMRAVLLNPDGTETDPFATVSAEAAVTLR
jgi:hypothetical protein